jgi:hypothetical protein
MLATTLSAARRFGSPWKSATWDHDRFVSVPNCGAKRNYLAFSFDLTTHCRYFASAPEFSLPEPELFDLNEKDRWLTQGFVRHRSTASRS